MTLSPSATVVNRPKRIVILLALFALATGLIIFTTMAFLGSTPPAVTFSPPVGQPVNLTLQTVGTIGFGVHPDWVSYLVKNPAGKWEHTTLWQVPPHTKIDVTIEQFDSGSPLRNQENGLVTGVKDARVDGSPFSLTNSYAGLAVGHTFSVPELGINVPLPGVNPSAKNFCGAAPCPLSDAHKIVTFSFTSPAAGTYRWQCFIPCGVGFLYGNGGAMQTIGYMDGFLEVT